MRAKQLLCFNNSRFCGEDFFCDILVHFRQKWFPLQSVLMYFCGFGFCSKSCYAVLSVQSSFTIILLYFNCLPADFWLLVLCVSSLQCCELDCAE